MDTSQMETALFFCERGLTVTAEMPKYATSNENIIFIFVRDGTILMDLNLTEYRVCAGELLTANVLEFSSLRAESGTAEYDRIVISPMLLSRFLTANQYKQKLKFNLLFKNNRHFSAEFLEKTEIRQKTDRLLENYGKDSMFGELISAGILLEICGILCNYVADHPDLSDANGPGDLFCEKFPEILKYTHLNFISCEEREVAKHFGLSYSYFSRVFKKAIGISYIEYIHFLKINEAKRLLCETDLPIHEIAQRLHFSTPSHLINVFKKHVGVSPRIYRINQTAAV